MVRRESDLTGGIMILLTDQQIAPKIICDQSLEDTAHWLRAAGYDVYVPFESLTSDQFSEIAQREQRVLIVHHNIANELPPSLKGVVSIDSPLVFEQIKQIGKHLKIDWLYKPFSRCMVCNTAMVKLNINQWIDLPEEIHNRTVTSCGCPSCRRIYWAGEEINRMVDQLQSFKSLDW